eukprot:scaffold70800_cov68-Attheya_sp.AAC.2
MFVQQGQDWDDGDADGGGNGRICVVIKLNADTGYTEVVWPCTTESMCSAALERSRALGIAVVESIDISKYYIGQKINSNCVVVGIRPNENLITVAPVEPIPFPTPTRQPPQVEPTTTAPRSPRKPCPPPDSWDTNNNDSG